MIGSPPDRQSPRPPRFYDRGADEVARDLLGDWLVSHADPERPCGGPILETEAYLSEGDDANHAVRSRKTDRNRPMFGPPGTIYVYLIYGMYHCLNVVCREKNVPEAVLIRAVDPRLGTPVMKRRREERRSSEVPPDELTSGPGKLCMALDVDRAENGTNVHENDRLHIYRGDPVPDERIVTGPRVGVDYAENAADWPLRFRVTG